MFAGLTLSLGGLVGARLARRTAPSGTEPDDPRPLLRTGTLLGLVSALGLAVTLLGDGSLVAGFSAGSVQDLFGSTPGNVAAAEVLAFAVAGAAVLLHRPRWAGLALAAVAGAEGIRAHPQAATPGWGATVIFVHLGAASIWIGALVHVVRVGRSRRTRSLSARTAVAAYARLALWLFALVLATGTMSGLLLAGPAGLRDTLFGTTYGRWLLAKIALVVIVAGVALSARHHLRNRPSLPQPGRAARVEVVGLTGVLAVSALLTSLSPPAPRDAELPFPPPPVGPISAAGGARGGSASASQRRRVSCWCACRPGPGLLGRHSGDHDLRPRRQPDRLRGPGTPSRPVAPLRRRMLRRGRRLAARAEHDHVHDGLLRLRGRNHRGHRGLAARPDSPPPCCGARCKS